MYDYQIIDLGSTYTKLRVFDHRQLLATSQSPTTLEDIYSGVRACREELIRQLDVEQLVTRATLVSCSAAGGLRMVAMGYMARVTAKAAKEVAMNSGAKILEILSDETEAGQRIEVLKEIAPDIILLAGGTDFGNRTSLIRNAQLIVESGIKSTVIVAGNIEAQPEAAGILKAGGVPFIRVPNIMPTVHELHLTEAREAIHQEFIRQITRAHGLKRLQAEMTGDRIIPTPGAVLMAAEILAVGSYDRKGIGDIIVIDLGGATTDVHSVLPRLATLGAEEIGLIVSNEKQVSYRTVEGNLGMRVSALGVINTAHPRAISQKFSPDEDMSEALLEHGHFLEAHPDFIPKTEQEKRFDQWIATTAVDMALRRHAGYYSAKHDPVTGIVPGTPVGRDLRKVETIIVVGGWFAHHTQAEADALIQGILADPGVSLLPQQATVYLDSDYLMYACGVIGQKEPSYAFDLLERYIMKVTVQKRMFNEASQKGCVDIIKKESI